MPNGGQVCLHVDCTALPAAAPLPPGPYLRLDVTDEGRGVSPDLLPVIFEPFVTTKGPGEGTGLGLSVAYEIVTEHGGWIDVRSAEGRGCCFSIYLPAEPEHSA
jgi:signal transduction histidine kinase